MLKESRATAVGWPQMSEFGGGRLIPHLLLTYMRARSESCLVELLKGLVLVQL